MGGYAWGWIICIAATAVVIGLGFWMTRNWRPRPLRELVRAFAVTTLLVPVTTGPSGGYFAPAYIVLIFEVFLKNDGEPAMAMVALTLAWSAGLVLLFAIWVRRWLARRQGSGTGQASSPRPSPDPSEPPPAGSD